LTGTGRVWFAIRATLAGATLGSIAFSSFALPFAAAARGRGPWPTPRRPAAGLANSLRVPSNAPDLQAHPALVSRLRDSPHNYFRFVNPPFSHAVCEWFVAMRAELPEVTLHGDVHVEQYAITSLGRGLTDFDAAARGPSVIDLVRFGVSLELAAREKGWSGEGRRAFEEFLQGYRDALQKPALERPPRRLIRHSQAAFARDHALSLRRADALMDADPVAMSDLTVDFVPYVAEMRRLSPGLPASYFLVKKAGRLHMGIGSALDEKYLLRIEGRSAEDGDDQILEAKLVRPLAEAECVHTEVGPQRVTLGMALIANFSFPLSGLVTGGGRAFWLHGWTDDYVELSIESSFRRPGELRELAYDVGTQLGRGHPRVDRDQTPPESRRRTLLRWTRDNEGRIRKAIDDLTDATLRAWIAFREETGPVGLARACDQPIERR
jgi:Uncharacterized protein conserved in bacteria (DUF2252)